MNKGSNNHPLSRFFQQGETVGMVLGAQGGATMNDTHTRYYAEHTVDDYDERPVQSVRELEELVRLRTEISWSAWKSHPRFKKDRLIRDAQRRFGGVPCTPLSVKLQGYKGVQGMGIGPTVPANDTEPTDVDAELGNDPEFSAVCDASRDAWIEALESQDPREDSSTLNPNDAREPRRSTTR